MYGLIGCCLLLGSAGAALANPSPSEDETPATPLFGVDLAGGYGGGAVLGDWADPGVGGYGWIQAGAYPVARGVGGPRVGASAWADLGVAPAQNATEAEGETITTFPFKPRRYGLAVSFRYDPAARWTGTFDFGFGRMDLDAYYGGPQAIPVFDVRAGVHRGIGNAFVDAAARTAWGEARDPTESLTEWWTVGVELGFGYHVR